MYCINNELLTATDTHPMNRKTPAELPSGTPPKIVMPNHDDTFIDPL